MNTETILLSLPREIFYAWRKKGVAHRVWVWHTFVMPDQGSPDKAFLSVRIPRALKKRLEKLAASRGESLTDLIISLSQKAVTNIELTAEDYRNIAAEVAEAEKTIKSKKSIRSKTPKINP